MNMITPILGLIDTLIDKAVPDRGKAAELKASLKQQALNLSEAELKSQTSIIVAEATGDSWLQRNWRPLVMMFLTGLVGAHWLGFTPAGLTEAEVLSLLGIVKVGLGGYVVGRSAEKTMKVYKG